MLVQAIGRRKPGFAGRLLACVATTLMVAAAPAFAQQDRERAQMLQMQQQLQRLQSDNAALQSERTQLQAKIDDAEKLRKDAERADKDLARLRTSANSQSREISGLRDQLRDAQALSTSAAAQIRQLTADLAARDAALLQDAAEKKRTEAERVILVRKLAQQSDRVQMCEAKHAGVMAFSEDLISNLESNRLRACEPVTGIWRVHEESRIQQLRDTLFEFRLDVATKRTGGTSSADAVPGRVDEPGH